MSKSDKNNSPCEHTHQAHTQVTADNLAKVLTDATASSPSGESFSENVAAAGSEAGAARTEGIDTKRRAFLTKATMTVGAAGMAMAAVPFVSSMLPSKSAEAGGAPIKVDISKMKVGDQLTVSWRGRPVWIVKRSPEALASLDGVTTLLRDPNSDVAQQPIYARNQHRSIKPEILVLVGVCTHLGCAPTYRPDKGGVDEKWPGGFFCSCHGSRFDMAGRVYKGVPAPINLEVPPHAFINDNELIIGTDNPSEVA